MEAPALSAYAMEPQPRGGLLLGYAGYGTREIREGMRRLVKALETEFRGAVNG